MDQIERPWTPEEDKMMQNLAAVIGMDWLLISKSLPGRTVKSCWSRWISLCCTFTPGEDEMLENLVKKHGQNWSLIGQSMPGKSAMSCKTRWSLLTPKGISWSLKKKSSSMTDEDKTIDAHKIPPQSFGNLGITQGGSFIHDGIISHEVGGISGKAPSIGDMARGNMSSGSVHSFTRDKSAPSWNDLNKRYPSLLMIESDMVQEFSSAKSESMMTERDNTSPSIFEL